MRISDWSSDVCSSDLGGGKELLVKLYNDIGGNVESFLSGPMPTQAFGWFKKPVTKTADLKGLKFRTNGLAIDLFTAMGAAVNARSEEHTSELQSLMSISSAVFCLQKNNTWNAMTHAIQVTLQSNTTN